MSKGLYLPLFLGLIVMLILSILPMPAFFADFRPPWILLLVLYILYFLPAQFNVLALVIVGLMLDVLLATVIGEHSFALIAVTWLAASKARRFHFFSMMQQMIFVGFFCFLYQVIIAVIEALLGFQYSLAMPLGSAAVGILIWPWIRLFCEDTLTRVVYR